MPRNRNYLDVIFDEIRNENLGSCNAEKGNAYREKILEYYKNLYEINAERRTSSWRSTVQVVLSRLKKKIKAHDYPHEFCNVFRLSAEDNRKLRDERQAQVYKKSIGLEEIHAEAVVLETRQILRDYLNDKVSPYLAIVALGALTGRRTVEILLTGDFDPPKEHHFTDEKYWCHFSGVAKRRDYERKLRRDIPLLDEREVIVAVVNKVREALNIVRGTTTNETINKRFAKPISRAIQPRSVIQKMHDFRKFYCCTAFIYFNDNNCSLPRFAANNLMHKDMNSSVITYLASRIKVEKNALNFGKGLLAQEATR